MAEEAERGNKHFAISARNKPVRGARNSGYGESGTGTVRHYVHDHEEARSTAQIPAPSPNDAAARKMDLLFYEGLHGAA